LVWRAPGPRLVTNVMAKFNWERAAKEDYIARHGSLPGWGVYAQDDEARLERKEVDLRVRLQKTCLKVVADFAALPGFERRRRYEAYFHRLCRLFDAERDRVAPQTRLDRAIREYEAGALALLKGLLPASQAAVLRRTKGATTRLAKEPHVS
jgi:hypothetical protein